MNFRNGCNIIIIMTTAHFNRFLLFYAGATLQGGAYKHNESQRKPRDATHSLLKTIGSPQDYLLPCNSYLRPHDMMKSVQRPSRRVLVLNYAGPLRPFTSGCEHSNTY